MLLTLALRPFEEPVPCLHSLKKDPLRRAVVEEEAVVAVEAAAVGLDLVLHYWLQSIAISHLVLKPKQFMSGILNVSGDDGKELTIGIYVHTLDRFQGVGIVDIPRNAAKIILKAALTVRVAMSRFNAIGLMRIGEYHSDEMTKVGRQPIGGIPRVVLQIHRLT